MERSYEWLTNPKYRTTSAGARWSSPQTETVARWLLANPPDWFLTEVLVSEDADYDGLKRKAAETLATLLCKEFEREAMTTTEPWQALIELALEGVDWQQIATELLVNCAVHDRRKE